MVNVTSEIGLTGRADAVCVGDIVSFVRSTAVVTIRLVIS